ncbi:MAG: hypothetical protein HQL31_04260 [Planctomycetes bacterium]|nr:hypothetical protein [Planctomycetota bacterium]
MISKGRPILIGMDLGSSAIKGVLTDAAGMVLHESSVKTPLLRPTEHQVESDPEGLYRNVCAVLRQLSECSSGEVRALAMAVASGNTLLTDGSGIPLMNTIHWMDRRAEQTVPAFLAGLSSPEVHRVTGWPCVSSFPLAHLAWLREKRPELYASAGYFGMDSDWLLFRLTGKRVMDHSTATTFHLQEQISGSYYRPFLERLGITMDKLPALVPSGAPVTTLTARAQRDTGLSAETLVVSGSFDHPAAARASGVRKAGQLMLSCGTSWVGFAPFDDRDAILDAGLLCDPFLSGEGGPWAGLFSVPAIGPVIDWYVNHAIAPGKKDPFRTFNEMSASSSPGAGGLVIDLSAPPGPVVADRASIARAVMEGAARSLNQRIIALRSHGFAFSRAVMVGGPSRSPVWPGILAEMTGLEISVGSTHAGATGAAILAGIGAGVCNNGTEEK